MSNRRYGALQVGVTNDIVRRAWEHREGVLPGFTRRYGLHDLVRAEPHLAVLDPGDENAVDMVAWPA
jgi:putative endonuclease